MSSSDSLRSSDTGRLASGFALYVEGPSDREFLRIWSGRVSPKLGRAVDSCSVILGGRQPARALRHFEELRREHAGVRGLCVLDRDDCQAELNGLAGESGLEFYTWPRRHIESYLLVEGAIGRAARPRRGDTRLGRILREHLPPEDDERALSEVDAKRLLSPYGALSRALGTRLSVGRVARALREDELHRDVHDLFDKLREALGMQVAPPTVVRRTAIDPLE